MSKDRLRKKGFASVPNQLLDDDEISLQAKGFYGVLASNRDGWEFVMSELTGRSTNGREATQRACKELEDAGWLVRSSRKDEAGRFAGWDWRLTVSRENRQTEKPSDGKAVRDNKTNSNKTNSNNTNIPTLSEVEDYFAENGYKKSVANDFWNYYNASVEDNPQLRYWRDAKGNKVKSWKQKARAVWFKEEHKIPKKTNYIAI